MDAKADLTLRRAYRAQLTKLCNSASDIGKSTEVDSDNISVMCEKIKLLRVSLNELNAKIIPTLTDDIIQSECDKIADYELNAMEAIATLEVYMKRKYDANQGADRSAGGTVTPAIAAAAQGNFNDGNNSTHSIQQKTVRLPKLDLIKFNGDIELWPQFWEQYNQAIHTNTELDNNSKYAYLKTLVTGKAAISISGLTSSQSSYNDAVEFLKSEFGQSERIIDCYLQKLCALPPVKYDKDVTGLRRLYNTASTITRSLETLGISCYQYGLMVKSMIFKVLPYNLKVQFNKQKFKGLSAEISAHNDSGSGDSNQSIDHNRLITDLLNFIKIEVDALEQAQGASRSSFSNHEKEKTNDKDSKSNVRNRYKSQNTESFTAQGLLNLSKDCCLFCKNKSHESKNCRNTSITLDEKKRVLKDSSRCFRCTGLNHRSKFCKSKDISCLKCKGRHVTALCDPSYKPNNQNERDNKPNYSSNEQSALTAFASGRINNVYLQTACVFLNRPGANENMLVRMIIDGGSQLTFIKQCLSRELNLPVVGTHKISICSFGSSQRGAAKLCNKVEVLLRSQYSNETIIINAIEAPQICFDSINPPSQIDPHIRTFSENNQLADYKTRDLDKSGISLLIGADNYWRVVNNEAQHLTDNLTAVRTIFGWTIHGSSDLKENTDFSVNFNVATILHAQIVESDTELISEQSNEPNLKQFWDLETLGINTLEIKGHNDFTEQFIKYNVTFTDNRYEVKLPWQTNKILDSNYASALIRAKNLVNKLCKNGLLVEYDRAIREYRNLGCAELITEKDIKLNNAYYMPHRPVYRRDKETTQVRVVFDASAHAPGMLSLNDKLATGENLVPELLKILLQFRFGSVGLIADIEKAFLQISLCKEDRDYHRFLWFNDPIENELSSVTQLPEFNVFRMRRVTFGVTTSPFLLAVTLRKHLLGQSDQEFGKILLNSFYVDDFVITASNENEAMQIYERSKAILLMANMNLRKWCTNNASLTRRFNENAENSNDNLLSNVPKKVLGIQWYTVTDHLVVDIQRVLNDFKNINDPTKRIILKIVASIFDPLGMVGTITIRIKILLQKCWKRNIKWDEPLPNDFKEEWFKWIQDVSCLKECSIPRCILSNKTNPLQLHIFADASPQAYGIVAYIKCLTTNECNFFISKNRVAPINQMLTLPKLELTAALCASRMQKYIVNNIDLNIKHVFLWTDSKITLYWIKGNKKLKQFEHNRVNEIRDNKNTIWKYCPGKDNPADVLTRDISVAKWMKENGKWLHGPSWLTLEEEKWPNDEPLEESTVIACLLEAEEEPLALENKEKIRPIFDIDRYSSLERVLRVTALMLRFINNVKKTNEKINGELGAEELEQAEQYWIRLIQQEEYFEEIHLLRKGKEIPKKSSILKLNPFIDKENILRLTGRLQEAEFVYSEKHPIIIPKNSSLTTKIIWKAHNDAMHSGINSTLTIIRRKYWIIQARQKIKSTISKCVICKRLKGKSGMEPFAPLPKDRITMARPFDVTGIDFAGPLYVKGSDGQISKAYIMLFTCAVIRAVHLELIANLSTESSIMGLRRFISRRGVPTTVYSDNAKAFKRTVLELNALFSILQGKEVQDLARQKRIKWKFSIERGSWWGGFWERLVRTVKSALKSTLGRKMLNFDELRTVLTEVEATVNSRPLTYIDEDPTNLFILTPSKFLIGEKDIGLSADLKLKEIKDNGLLQIWKLRQTVTDKFWRIWKRDYLQQLRSAHYTEIPKSKVIREGDVVLLEDQDRPRLMWKIVKVIQTFQGRDTRTRACEILTSEGTKLRRPIQCLYPLEVRSFAPAEDVENPETG